ncbi:MAG: XRE family transcriptional regulator [Janthinobacterium lividum]
MTYQEFQRHVGKAGLTISEFAELIRMNRISISNLSKRGEVPPHLAVIACLLGEMAERKIDFQPLIHSIGLEPRKPRGGGAKGSFGGSRQADLFTKGRAPGQQGLARKPEHTKNAVKTAEGRRHD